MIFSPNEEAQDSFIHKSRLQSLFELSNVIACFPFLAR